jgi:large subunit ribosomal protein L4
MRSAWPIIRRAPWPPLWTTLEAKRSVLLVNTIEANRNLELGSRNLPGVKLVATKDVTTYDLLAHKYVVISEAAAKKLSEALAQ